MHDYAEDPTGTRHNHFGNMADVHHAELLRTWLKHYLFRGDGRERYSLSVRNLHFDT